MLSKLFVGLLLSSSIIIADSSITENELLKFSTTTKTVYSQDKYDNSFIKGYWKNHIDKLNSYLKPKTKTVNTERKKSFADKYSSILKSKDNTKYNKDYWEKLKALKGN